MRHVCRLNMSTPDALPWAHQTGPGRDSQRREGRRHVLFTHTHKDTMVGVHRNSYQIISTHPRPCAPAFCTMHAEHPQIDFYGEIATSEKQTRKQKSSPKVRPSTHLPTYSRGSGRRTRNSFMEQLCAGGLWMSRACRPLASCTIE